MEILNLKDTFEKDSFFRKLPNIAEQLPREIVLKKVLPKSQVEPSILHSWLFSTFVYLFQTSQVTLCVYLLFGLLCAQLLPVLASSLEFGSAAAPALTVLLKMGSWLPADQFSIKVTFSYLLWLTLLMNYQVVWLVENAGSFQVLPTIVKLFASNDRAIRACLLHHIDQFGESMSAQTVDEQVCDILYGQSDICFCSIKLSA